MRRTPCTAAAIVAAVSLGIQGQTPTPALDVILRNGTVIDGTGAPPAKADVGIKNDRIAGVGDLKGRTATADVDVSGLYVTPGFINIHSHPIQDGLTTAANMLTQGVTTEMLNPDGGGPTDIAQQLQRLEGLALAVNAGAFLGFNSAWTSVVGAADRRPGPDDVTRMRDLIVKGLTDGAWGVSAGLDYKPAYFARTAEVTRIVSAAAAWRTIFTSHDRITPESGFSSRVGIAETMEIGRGAALIPVITHMKAQGVEQGQAPAILRMMARATAAGRYTAADAYPYLAGQSGLGALIIPGWAQEGGRDAMLARFNDREARTKIVAESEKAMKARFGGPEGVYVTTIERELADVMREMHVTAGEAVIRLLEQREMGAILRFGAERDLVAILQHPTTSIACDCGATSGPASHPRYYGSYPRVLGRYVRETKALTWEDAVRKMTGLPAATVGLVDRGLLAPGMMADVTVFDPAAVIDHATFETPTARPDGVRHVVVNGRFALRDGAVTEERSGRVLRRTAHMPSRPMNPPGARRVFAKANGLTLDIRQDHRGGMARGALTAADPGSTARFESSALGVLQVADRWASVTGRGRVIPGGGGEERAFTAIVDAAGPNIDAGRAMLLIEVEGRPEPFRIPLDSRSLIFSPQVRRARPR